MPLKNITTPLDAKTIQSLNAGDEVSMSGVLYTARDLAHKQFKKTNRLPFKSNGQVIFYAGPTPGKGKKLIGSIGPTTSSRVDAYVPMLLKKGIKGFIGKGERSQEVLLALKKHQAVYFIAPSGVAALLSKYVKQATMVALNNLGPEAVYKLSVDKFPLIVAIDSHGRDIYGKN